MQGRRAGPSFDALDWMLRNAGCRSEYRRLYVEQPVRGGVRLNRGERPFPQPAGGTYRPLSTVSSGSRRKKYIPFRLAFPFFSFYAPRN